MKRAIRRHHNDRLRKRAVNIGKHIWGSNTYWTEQWLRENYNTLKQCSCRNPRKSLGQITKQEKVANYDFKEQIREWRKRLWLREH